MNIATVMGLGAALLCLALPPAAAAGPASPGPALERFARDYAADPSLTTPVNFGISVDGQMWSVTATPANAGKPAGVRLVKGKPAKPTFYYAMSAATLVRLDEGSLNALTAAGKARESDKADLEFEVMPGFDGTLDNGKLISVLFHFFTRGLPETIAFSSDRARAVHGAHAVVFYYQPGLRSAWLELRPGDHANADPKDQTNPFPSLFIVTKGHSQARIGGRKLVLEAGRAVLIPAGTAHEFWNDGDESAEGILIMFGEGA